MRVRVAASLVFFCAAPAARADIFAVGQVTVRAVSPKGAALDFGSPIAFTVR